MECKFCSKCIENKGSLAAHEKGCQNNPDRVSKGRSPLAGRQKGCVGTTTGMKLGTHPRWRELYPNERMFSENCDVARQSVKKRILDDAIMEYKCSCCGIEAIWNNKPMVLILDHINGINNDNRLENLRFVCSNCDSQLDTYKAKNRRKIREVDETQRS